VPDDKVVEKLEIEEACGGKELGGEAYIFIGRLRIAAGVIVHGRKADASKIENWSYEFGDTHTGSRRSARIYAPQIKESIAAIDGGDVELLLARSANEWGGERG
jgi:hypothetical protein